MKKILFIPAISLMLASCTEREVGLFEQSVQPIEVQMDEVIDLDEAIAISNKFRSNSGYSRSLYEELGNIEYVVRKQSRSNDNSDTIANIPSSHSLRLGMGRQLQRVFCR